MRHADHLIVAFDKQGGDRERRSFEACEAMFDVVLVPILPHCLRERQALLRRIAGLGTPTEPRHEVGNRLLIALDRGNLIAHALIHLLWAVGSTSSTPDELDLLLALARKAVGEQPHDTMLGEHGLGGALQRLLL